MTQSWNERILGNTKTVADPVIMIKREFGNSKMRDNNIEDQKARTGAKQKGYQMPARKQ